MKKRIIVILTCIMMVVAFMPAVTFAASNPTMKYVALGDASTAGYGMADTVGYNKVAAGSYPALVRDEFKARNYNVTLSQLAMSEMRTEELLYMLDDDYKAYGGDAYFRDNFAGKVTETMRTNYKNRIKNADVVTYNLGSVNVGSYFLYIAKDVEGRCDDPEIKALVAADGDGIKAAFNNEIDNILSLESVKSLIALAKAAKIDVDALIAENRDKYVNAAAYAYYSFCSSYDKTIQKIKELNKKAPIIVFGVRNMLGDLKIQVLSKDTIALGELYNKNLVKKVNSHMQKAAGIKFIAAADVKTFLNEVSNYGGYSTSVTAQFKRYCDVLEDDLMLKNDVSSYVKSKYQIGVDTRITWGMKGVYDTVATCLKNVATINKVNKVNITSSDVQFIVKEGKEKLADVGKDLMQQMRGKSFELAKKAADQKSLSSYQTELRDFVNKTLYKTSDVPENISKVIMAVGLRSEMGKGFFLHPSAAGHKQIKNLIINYLCPVKTSITKLTPAKKAFTVKWSKKANINGYQIRYSLKSGMGSAKTVNIANKATVSKKITKLKAKKKYYVQVRTYKTTNGKKYFSVWSVKKSVKTK